MLPADHFANRWKPHMHVYCTRWYTVLRPGCGKDTGSYGASTAVTRKWQRQLLRQQCEAH